MRYRVYRSSRHLVVIPFSLLLLFGGIFIRAVDQAAEAPNEVMQSIATFMIWFGGICLISGILAIPAVKKALGRKKK